jgi:TRAP-type uncharacterized transport system substrate-binding protein
MQARVTLREQGSNSWAMTLFGSDSPAVIREVGSRRNQIAIVNPSMVLTMAAQGAGPFEHSLPVRTIAVLPSFDQIIFAVGREVPLKSVSDIKQYKLPLKLSLRGQADHSLHLILAEVLAALSLSLDDIRSWGGEIRYDSGMPGGLNRLGAVERGEINAIFDESAYTWGYPALDLGMRFLSFDEPVLTALERTGLRRSILDRRAFPKLSHDVPTLDFSGWPIYTHKDTADSIVTAFCGALENRKDQIPCENGPPLPLERMVRDSAEAPLKVPLHFAAERYWRERGYL